MEFTRRSYAVVYVILLCALAQGGSEGKGGKEEEISRDGGEAFSSSINYVHGINKVILVFSNFNLSLFFCLFMIVLGILLSILNKYLMTLLNFLVLNFIVIFICLI